MSAAGETSVIVAPPACPLPPGRAWGWAAQLYATRLEESWGIGDLGDLRRLGAWSTRRGSRARIARGGPARRVLRHRSPGPVDLPGEADRRAVGPRRGRLPGRQFPRAV